MKKLAALALSSFLLISQAQALSPEIRYDMLKLQLSDELKAKQYADVAETIIELKVLGKKLPDSLIFIEAKALFESGREITSQELFKAYLEKVGKEGKYYTESLRYLLKAEKIAKKTRKNHHVTSYKSSTFAGTWKNDLPHGYGMLSGAIGNYYGEFKNGKYHGKGRLSPSDMPGTTYEGDFKNGRPSGFIVRTFDKNGKVGGHTGGFQKGVPHGFVKFKIETKDGSYKYRHSGWYENGQKHGQGTEWNDDGSVISGKWIKGHKEGIYDFTPKGGKKRLAIYLENLPLETAHLTIGMREVEKRLKKLDLPKGRDYYVKNGLKQRP